VGTPLPASSAEEGFEAATRLASGGSRGRELLWAHLDYTLLQGRERSQQVAALSMPVEVPSWHGASRAFRWAAAVASFGMELLEDPLLTGANWEMIEALARSAAGESEEDYLEFVSMIEQARGLD
jgi:hypothetical protein